MNNKNRYSTFAGFFVASLLAATGCTSEQEVDTTAFGVARYQDAETDEAGNPRDPSGPASQEMAVAIHIEGSGELSGLEPQCTLDSVAGSFEGELLGTATIDEDGAYVAALASSTAEMFTPSGCEIPELEITALSEVLVRATIAATTQNCESYCSAKARSHGEAECGAEPGSASCRLAAEGDYRASCQTSCRSETTHVLVAESRLSATALAELTATSLTGAALGEISVDLSFDRIETAEGETVEETR
jgi:hypothetical protein